MQSGAVYSSDWAMPGVVFVGSRDGHLRAYDAADGTVLWDFDTVRDFDSVDPIKAHADPLARRDPSLRMVWYLWMQGTEGCMAMRCSRFRWMTSRNDGGLAGGKRGIWRVGRHSNKAGMSVRIKRWDAETLETDKDCDTQ
jgi:hypothetical protein